MSIDSQMIGRRGEKRFDLLCSDANVTCNRSVEDDYGWDKLIEFPPRTLPFAAIDMQPGRTTAAVQVKTTTGASRSISISLSNALHYARSTIPQFIVLVVLEANEARYFVRHVWMELIAQWLKRGREADARGVTAINQETVNISFSPEDEHGDDLLTWIEAQIHSVRPSYAAAKQLILDTVGFENGYGTARMTIALDDPDQFLDIQLGLHSQVKAKRFVYTSERFGIQAGRPEFDQRDVLVQITPEGRDCAMRLEFPDGGSVTVPAKLYGADDGSSTAFRLASRTVDLVYGPRSRIRANAKLKVDERLAIDDLSAFAHLLATNANTPVSVHIRFEERTFDMGSITMNGTGQDPGWSWMALSIQVMKEIAVDARREAPDVSIAELNTAAGSLEILTALASDRLLRIDYTPTGGVIPHFDGLLAYSFAEVGEHYYSVVVYRPIVLDRTTRGRRRITFGPRRLVWGQLVSSVGWSADSLAAAYRRQLDRLSESAQLMALGDFAKAVHSGAGERELLSDLPTERSAPMPLVSRRTKRLPRKR